MDEIPEPVVLPCGCFIRPEVVHGENRLIISPCRPGCVNLANAVELARDKGKRVKYRNG